MVDQTIDAAPESKKKTGSVLQRLRGQLTDAGLIGHKNKLVSAKSNKSARQKERLETRKVARQRLKSKDVNPYELKFAKPKHEVLGRKVRGVGGRPGLTRVKAEAKVHLFVALTEI
jgi:nucleolar protein 14